MDQYSGPEDLVFRIGGDEFAMLTASEDAAYAKPVAERILAMNGQTFTYEDREIGTDYIRARKITIHAHFLLLYENM